LELLPRKASGPLRQRDGPLQQLAVEIVGDHARAKLDQHALRERRLGRPQTAQDQLPPRIELRGHDGLGIADLVIRLKQEDHRQQRRRHRRRAAWSVHRGQLRLERVVEQLRAHLAEKHIEFADSVQRLGHARLLGRQLSRTCPVNGSRHVRIRSQADPEVDPLCV